MKYDHIVKADENLAEERFHLACGYYTTTSFMFEKANFSVVIDCSGIFTFYTTDDNEIETVKAKPMEGGRERYMDVFITTTDEGVMFRLPDYSWTDNYPYCDGESDRWDAEIIGTNDEIFFKAVK